MSKATGIIFFIAWILCGCCLDCIFEDPRAFVIVVVALIVALGCMFRMCKEDLSERW